MLSKEVILDPLHKIRTGSDSDQPESQLMANVQNKCVLDPEVFTLDSLAGRYRPQF